LFVLAACSDRQPVNPDDLDLQAAKPDRLGPVKVEATDPSSGEQTERLLVRVLGSGFDDGSVATWIKGGDPTGVMTHTTSFVSSGELVADIEIEEEAQIGLWDVEVMTVRGKKGIGIESFEVKQKTPPGQLEYDDYTAIDLGPLGGPDATSYTKGVSDDLGGGTVRIVGFDGVWGRSNHHAITWEATGTEVVGPTQLPLPKGRKYSLAAGVSDNGRFVVGWVYQPGLAWPARWVDGAFDRYLPHGIENPGTGIAKGVNNSGEAVGSSKSSAAGIESAIYWDAAGNPTPLSSPLGGHSKAYAINNQGHIAGTGWQGPAEELPRQAFLWRRDAPPCHLDPDGINSGAEGLTDVNDGGRVFVAGYSNSRAAVWEVVVSSCEVARRWVAEGESLTRKIRSTDDGWEAIGFGHLVSPNLELPEVWSFSSLGGLTATPLAREGKPWDISGDGRVVGQGPVTGQSHPFIWIPVGG
jgi:hypothetical protein